jgi:hypothetical protein
LSSNRILPPQHVLWAVVVNRSSHLTGAEECYAALPDYAEVRQ